MKYYIRDTRQTVGNCALWWAKGGNGYTTQLEEAGEYDEEEARRIERSRGTDRAIPVVVAKYASVTHVRVERLGRAMEALDDKRVHLSTTSGRDAACGADLRFRNASSAIASVTCEACRTVPQ